MLFPHGIGAEESPIANDVDETGHSARKAVDAAHRRAREQWVLSAGHQKPVLNVGIGFTPGESEEVISGRNALSELPQPPALSTG